MKTQSIKKIWLAALPLALMTVACQNEDIIEEKESVITEGTTVIRAIMGSHDTPQSRAQVELGNADESQEVFKWNGGDSFTLYDQNNPAVSSGFTLPDLADGSYGSEANFISEDAWQGGTDVVAIYPVNTNVPAEGIIPLTLPDGDVGNCDINAWVSYMSRSMFMYAQGTIGNASTELTFNHLCSMVRISYTNATTSNKTFSPVTLTGDGAYFGTAMDFDLTTCKGTVTEKAESLSLEFPNLSIESGETVDFYFLFFPGEDASNGTLTINMGDKSLNMSLSDLQTGAFKPGMRYWFNVMETSSALIWKKDLGEGIIANLKLLRLLDDQNDVDFTTNENGFVNVADNEEAISQITKLNIWSGAVDNLDGLEYLTALKELEVQDMGLKELNVSTLTALTELDCSYNKLTSLDVSQNTALQKLQCSGNALETLDVSQNTALTWLECKSNTLKELDLTANENLSYLDCAYNALTELDLSKNPNLVSIFCQENPIAAIDVTGMEDLSELNINDCSKIASIDVSKNMVLRELYCNNTAITSLDVSNHTKLRILEANYCLSLGSIDVTQCTNLRELYCFGSAISSIDLSDCESLKIINVMYCSRLTAIDLSLNGALTDLYCGYTGLTELDLSKNPNLMYLTCHGCHIQELDITQNTNLIFGTNENGVYFQCGNQTNADYESIPLTLYLTSTQASSWEVIKNHWSNSNVTTVVK